MKTILENWVKYKEELEKENKLITRKTSKTGFVFEPVLPTIEGLLDYMQKNERNKKI